MRYVLHEGKDFTDKDGRICREVMNIKIEIDMPYNDITQPIEKISSSRKWVYPRLDEIANITLTRKISPGHVYVYGQRIFNYEDSINQIDKFIIPLLRKDKTTRRALISLWNPRIDSNIFNKEVPSIVDVFFVKEDNKVNVTAIIRSNNVFFGMPANLYQIYLLQEYVSQRLGIEMGMMTLFLLSAHIFEDQFNDVEEMIS